MIKEIKISLSTDDDSRRIVKYVDIDLGRIQDGINLFGLLFIPTAKPQYKAVHRPTGIKSGTAWYNSAEESHALASCIERVLNSLISTDQYPYYNQEHKVMVQQISGLDSKVTKLLSSLS